MKKILIILTLALVILGLHCYALHKRIDYINGQCDREYARGITDAARAFNNAMVKIINEKEVTK